MTYGGITSPTTVVLKDVFEKVTMDSSKLFFLFCFRSEQSKNNF